MTAAHTGTLIIRSIPDGNDREQIIDFLCSFARGVARETVAARLETLPVTLGNAVPADIGNRMLASLQDLGAEAMFVHDRLDTPAKPAAPAARQPEPAHAKEPEQPGARKAATPAPPRPAAESSSATNDIRALVILLLVLVAGLCGATALFLPALKAASDPDLLLNKLLQKNADANNKTCPRNLNPQLRLDGYVAGNKRMTINYTLLNVDSTDVNGVELRSSVSRNIRQGVCKEKNSAELLKKDVAFVYVVHGKDSGQIFEYQVTKKECEEDTEG